ncbi:MAG: polyhydroxyalkanoate synthesis regulator DNA-binding domain-containing protein [Deltaproteobacteria bacterium]|nr:polyhydroxyalkanoate synthesis regulator DNA-binding domain-containing protein [Deltaproteobacteria bacterium]
MNTEKKPRVVKRYQNRKLYDTQNSCYVTLDDIAQFIKEGEDVMVIDNKNQDDLTAVTLTQIIFEQEKKKKNLLPLNALKNIIQSGGEQIMDFVQKSIQIVPSISNVKDEAGKVIDKIRDEIEDSGSFFKDFLSKSHQGVDDVTRKLEDKVKSLTNVSFVRNEIRSLRKKVALLERKLRIFDRK